MTLPFWLHTKRKRLNYHHKNLLSFINSPYYIDTAKKKEFFFKKYDSNRFNRSTLFWTFYLMMKKSQPTIKNKRMWRNFKYRLFMTQLWRLGVNSMISKISNQWNQENKDTLKNVIKRMRNWKNLRAYFSKYKE